MMEQFYLTFLRYASAVSMTVKQNLTDRDLTLFVKHLKVPPLLNLRSKSHIDSLGTSK